MSMTTPVFVESDGDTVTLFEPVLNEERILMKGEDLLLFEM